MTCEVYLNTLNGGSLDVIRIDPNPRLPSQIRPLQVFWHPPADGNAMDLVISYRAAKLTDFGVPDGSRVKFAPGVGSSADQFQADISDGGSQIWRFRADPDFGAEQGDFIMLTDNPAGKAVTAAINSGKSLKVVILKDGKTIASESFDTSATVGRDRLLAQARQVIETTDSRFCRPE